MLVYLASPYSAPTAREREERFVAVCKKAADLMQRGLQVFCPIAHSHPIEVHGFSEIEGHEFWLNQDFAILPHCEVCFVYKLPGWSLSRGVKAEIEFCEKRGIPVEYIEHEETARLLVA